MRHLNLLALAALLGATLAGCGSTAPYTLASASVHTALALGASAAERSAGGCWAMCTGGTVCNPRTGFCEEAPLAMGDAGCAMRCAPGTTCASDYYGIPRCTSDATLGVARGRAILAPGAGFPLGIAPASGTEPPPPVRSPEPGKP